MKDFVKTRFNPVLEENKYFQSLLDRNVNSTEVKKIRKSFMMFRSAWGGALGEGADIDFLGLDEYDRMDEGVETAFEEGLRSSKYGWMRRWSTPTIPGRGIDNLFQKSDQRYYMHKCDSCNHWQILSVEDNIKQVDPNGIDYITESVKPGTFKFVCAKCGKDLDRWYNGAWVAKYPTRFDMRGYHISQLNAVWISADSVMAREFKYTSKQLYHNYVIGEPYAAQGLIINEADIQGAQRFLTPRIDRTGYKKIIVGIDWGVMNWAAMMGVKEDGQRDLLNVWWFKDNPDQPLQPVKLIAAVVKPFNPDIFIADYGFGADRNAALMKIFKGKVFACKYQNFKDASQPMNNWNEKSRIVTVDKTLTVQNMLHAFKGQEIGLWAMDDKLRMLTKHLKNTRIMDVEEDEKMWQEATRVGPDHLASAVNYCLIGLDKVQNPFSKKRSGLEFDFI